MDGVSFRQDDILTMYSGLTVEINNTDAEGRLVLADGVAHVGKNLNDEVDLVMTMATLTGAQGISTGVVHSAVVCSDDSIEKDVIQAGLRAGDNAHPLPFAPECLLHEFDSPNADMKNSVKNRANCQVSCAGLFIWKHLDHTGFKGNFCHVDMAYPVSLKKLFDFHQNFNLFCENCNCFIKNRWFSLG